MRASSAAVIVPGAMLAALIVLAFAGGFGRPGSLGQAFAGPSAPEARLAGGSLPATSTATVSAAFARIGAARVAGSAGRGAARAVTPASSGSPAPRETGGSSGQLVVAGGSPGAGGNATVHQPPSSAPPPSKPAPAPTVADRVVSVATSVSRQIPAPVGSVTTQALQSAGSVLDRAAPVPAPGVRSALHLPGLPAS